MHDSRLKAVLIAASIASSNFSWAVAAETAIRVPIGCVGGSSFCEEDISLAKAKAAAEVALKLATACIQRKDEEKRQRELEQAKEKELERQQEEESKRRVARGEPPLLLQGSPLHFTGIDEPCLAPAATEENMCDNHSASYSWATVDQLSNGVEALSAVFERAKTGRPFNGHLIVAEAAESLPQEQHLALCEVRVINGTVGPPHDCATVAIVTPTVTLLRRGTTSISYSCETAASIRLGGSIDLDFNIQTKLDASAFSDSLAQMLRAELGFSIEQHVTKAGDGKTSLVSFKSTAPLRDSSILKGGWRESLDFDLYLSAEVGGVSVHGNTTPMVCRQASGQLIDYHGPDDAQKATYAKVLNDSLNTAITRACASFSQTDDKTIVCR
jgi:hypothetical protein